YTFITERWTIGDLYATVSALGLIVTVIQNPNGMTDAVRKSVERIRARHRPDRPHTTPDIPSELGTAGPFTVSRAGLTARDVTVRYGGLLAVDRASFDVQPGEIVGLIGPNGAGKTSLLDAITGFTRASGSIEIGAVTIDRQNPHTRYHSGLGRTWQSGQLFEDMTIFDNVRVAVRSARLGWTPGARRGAPARQDLMSVLHLLGIARLAS